MNDRIYLDNAATTAVSPEAAEAMLPFFSAIYGNASSIHGTGREARKAVEKARKQAAAAIGAQPYEVFFTSGGSESDNWAILGAAFANREKGRHLITTAIEHHAVLHPCQWLEKQGFEVTYLPVDGMGLVDPDQLEQAIRPDTVLISVMAANNEIGTLEPVSRIGEIARAHHVLFHTDAVQAIGAIPVDVNRMQADLLSLSGHKFHGPKGIGALYIRRGVRLDSLIHGGAQERGMRAGTENTAGIVGLGKAIEIAVTNIEMQAKRITALRDRLIRGIQQKIPEARLSGHPTLRLPNNCHLSFPGVNGEALVLRLDLAGIAVSGGSACTSGSVEPSHVLEAIGLPEVLSKGSVRLTLGTETTQDEIDETVEVLTGIVKDLQKWG